MFQQNNAGGTGYTTDISGVSVTYSTGGRGGDKTGFTGGATGASNTGDGGGGYGWGANGGAGGSGVVILRYQDIYAAASNTTGSPTVTTSGGYRIYKFTASGTITF